ncbi:MAG: peptidoglycan-binding domain-containing protein [Desulfuromonadales bacterium]|nr:peptidoglycan-binding domain-containing protein [Desulfuromonadales bacterium]
MAFIGGLFSAGLVLAAAETPAGLSSQSETKQQQQPGQQAGATGMKQHQAGATKLDSKRVNEMQKALNEKGYAVGRVDGVVGPQTTNAIREFQRKEGLSATGQPDQQTLKALGIEVGDQEFMGVSPEFGDEKDSYQPGETPMTPMERTDQMPMQHMEEQPKSSGSTETR